MRPLIAHVNAFTDKPFGGNPAAVCIWPSRSHDTHAGSSHEFHFREDFMQSLAAEMNLSETAFLEREQGGYRLRWFTPVCEVDLCGHATLASAHYLWEAGYVPHHMEIEFHTRSGVLKAAYSKDQSIDLFFPTDPASPIEPPFDLLSSVGARAIFTGQGKVYYLIEVGSEDEVRRLSPDFSKLQDVTDQGVIVTAKSDQPEYDFVSRFFAPAKGINEDPVTGSAHCTLGPYWAEKLKKNELVGYQASRRGGVVHVKTDHSLTTISGKAVTIFTGELTHAP